MEIIKAIVYGVLQGFFAWLPVSSVAHVRIVPALFGWEDPGAAYSAVLQLGTTVAVIVYFFKDLSKMTGSVIHSVKTNDYKSSHDTKLFFYILIGTIPIIICGVLFQKMIKNEFRGMYIVAIGLILFGIILYISEKVSKMSRKVDELDLKDTIIIGIFQVLALIPGCSRSGSTITGGFFRNLDRESAARYSFLLGLPAFILSGVFEIFKERETLFSGGHIAGLVIGTIISIVVGYLSIWFLLSYLKKHSILIFVVYRVALGLAIIILLQMKFISNY